MWLVKGGEDLRLDQRVEQMFGVFNEIFNADVRLTNKNHKNTKISHKL